MPIIPIQVQSLDLRTNNPYSLGNIETVDAYSSLYRDPVRYIKSNRDRYYVVVDGDTLPNMAYEAWGDSKLWWLLYDVNNLDNPFILKTGTTLVVPDLENLLSINN